MYTIIILFTLFNSALSVFNPTNETDLSRCQVHYSRSGTTYKDYYQLKKPKNGSSNLALDFHFSVLAPSDAHILLAHSAAVQKGDPAYEIVIGAGGNTFCDIRRMQKSQVKESVRIKGLLSALDVRSFWIHISKEGLLEVGREGEDLAFISWKDTDPLTVGVISFSTWPGIEAKWFFDCITDDIKRIKRNLTHVEQLRKDLLKNYDNYARPAKNHTDITEVTFAPVIESLLVDERKSMLTIRGEGRMSWKDDKLVWNASKYGNLDHVVLSSIEIWTPNIILYNAIDPQSLTYDNSLLTVRNNGVVNYNSVLKMKSWCYYNHYKNWPKDKRKCDLIFSTSQPEVVIKYPENTSNIFWNQEFPEWSIEKAEIYLNNLDEANGNTLEVTSPESSLYITLSMKRNSDAYIYIFLIPYIIAVLSILCTFCVSPFGYLKIGLGCLNLAISSICLLVLSSQIPTHPSVVPYIIQAYSYNFIAGGACIFIAIIVIRLSRIESQSTIINALSKLLTSKITGTIFCLPEIEKDEYGKLSKSKLRKDQQYCILLGIIIDRISLIIGIGFIVFFSITN